MQAQKQPSHRESRHNTTNSQGQQLPGPLQLCALACVRAAQSPVSQHLDRVTPFVTNGSTQKAGNMAWPFFSATTYGREPRPTEVPGEFKLRIYTGGLAGSSTADERATEIIEKFRSENGYSNYEIVARESRWFPSCYDYTIRFRKP